MDDVNRHARTILDTVSYVVLSTADAAGNPWATPVWFAADGLDHVYWASWPGSRHSQLIEHRPEVALTVFDSTVVPNEGSALYATARARRCPEDRLDEGLQNFNRRARSQGLTAFTRERLSGRARLRLYVADVTDLWVLDADADVDQRVAVPR